MLLPLSRVMQCGDGNVLAYVKSFAELAAHRGYVGPLHGGRHNDRLRCAASISTTGRYAPV
jgi:hypothetical protein